MSKVNITVTYGDGTVFSMEDEVQWDANPIYKKRETAYAIDRIKAKLGKAVAGTYGDIDGDV